MRVSKCIPAFQGVAAAYKRGLWFISLPLSSPKYHCRPRKWVKIPRCQDRRGSTTLHLIYAVSFWPKAKHRHSVKALCGPVTHRQPRRREAIRFASTKIVKPPWSNARFQKLALQDHMGYISKARHRLFMPKRQQSWLSLGNGGYAKSVDS